MKNRYCIGSKLPEDVFRALVRAYFMGKTTEDAARALKVSQGSVKNLYRRLTYRLIDGSTLFDFHYELLRDCFETGGRRVETLKRCLWECPGDKGYDSLEDRDQCAECIFAAEFVEAAIGEENAARLMYYHRRALAPLSSFNFVNRSAYIFAQQYLLYGSTADRRNKAQRFIANLKARPLGSAGTKEQIADRYVSGEGRLPHWYVVSLGAQYYLPNHEMM